MPKENAVIQAEKPVVKIAQAKVVKKETKATPAKESLKSKKKAEPEQNSKSDSKVKVIKPILQEETPTVSTTFEFLPTDETTAAVLATATATENEQFTGEIINGDEVVKLISVSDLYPPEFHPFQVIDDEAMTRLCESVKEYGVREPGLARLRFDKSGNQNGFELLCGNRRKRACEITGQKYMPVIIRELDDDNAVIAMVDSNLEQREQLLFSEKAWAYRIKMEALNHKGLKSDSGKTSAETLTEQTGESKNQIFRLIRLTELVVGLIDKVDMKQVAFNPAVELSYLSQTEQAFVISAMEEHDIKPSLSQAVRLRKLKQESKLTETLINSILAESKPKCSPADKEFKRYKKYFPDNYTPKQINKVITDFLKTWQCENSLQKLDNALIGVLIMPNNQTILKKLFHGEIYPSENIASGNSEYKKAEKTLNEMKHKFMKSLSDSQVIEFTEIMELQNQNTGLYGYESFIYGFKLATGLMFEALPKTDSTSLAVKLAKEYSETEES